MTTPCDILVIDDEESICFAFQRYFETRGHRVVVAASGRDGLARYAEGRPDIVFLDVRLPDISGLDVLEQLRTTDPAATVVVMTAFGSLETVTRAVRGKAFEYLVKPLDLDRAAEVLAQAIAMRAVAAAPNDDPPPDTAAPPDATSRTVLVGTSPAMQDVYKQIGKVAAADAAVLIRGETGTGKELVARAIHENSARHERPFVTVNCAALPDHLVESEIFGYVRGAFTGAEADKPGRFELADGGTLFLDEIGDLPLAAQVKLLRFLDSQVIERLGSVRAIHLNVRVVAATNRDLAAAIEAGRFRADLFYRLAVVQIRLPRLADRPGDIMPLARHLLDRRFPDGAAPAISAAAADLLSRYDWPGNVRELRNALDHAAIVSAGGAILPVHLPETVRRGEQPGDGADPAGAYIRATLASPAGQPGQVYQAAIAPLERALIEQAMRQAEGNQSAAAAWLGLHRNTLRNKLRELGLDAGSN